MLNDNNLNCFKHICEMCNEPAEIHHIVHKSEGGLDFPLNYKFLCSTHHRYNNGPHKNKITDLKYKVDLQNKLKKLLYKDYYFIDDLSLTLHLNKRVLKKLLTNLTGSKEGYKRDEIILKLMGNKVYSSELLENILLEEYII